MRIFLPPYSPELNPAEQVWRITRRQVTHNRYFTSVDELKMALVSHFGKLALPRVSWALGDSSRTFVWEEATHSIFTAVTSALPKSHAIKYTGHWHPLLHPLSSYVEKTAGESREPEPRRYRLKLGSANCGKLTRLNHRQGTQDETEASSMAGSDTVSPGLSLLFPQKVFARFKNTLAFWGTAPQIGHIAIASKRYLKVSRIKVEGLMLLKQAAGLIKRQVLQNRWLQGAGVALLVFFIYLLTGKKASPFNQFVLLSDAFLHGRLFLVDPPDWLELARYGEKAFVINPPAPVIFLLPFVSVWGTATNHIVISMAVGASAAGLFWVAGRQLGWSISLVAAMSLLLALGTNFWWASTNGSLWTFAHVSAVFFLTAAMVETTGSNRPGLVGILVGMAGLSRLPTFLTFPFFAYMVARRTSIRQNLIRISIFLASLAVMGLVYLAYNYGRYGSLKDLGYNHPQYALEPWFDKGRFHISYIPRHINAIFFSGPVFVDSFPYFKPSYLGLGLFFTTPALLYAFKTPLTGLNIAVIVTVLVTAVPLVTHGTTGWAQFGYRYSLDVLPLLAIQVAAGMQRPGLGGWAAILLSCGINLWGVLSFYKLQW